MDRTAHALADPIRREILLLLRVQPRTAGAVASAFSVSRPAVSRHLRVLREAELVTDELSGRERIYRLETASLEPLARFIEQLQMPANRWERRFDALETEVQRVRRRRRQGTEGHAANRKPEHERKRKRA